MRDTILIVEDDEMICQGIVDALQLRNWKTDVAATCEEAEKKIKEYTYMLYILDMKLPDGNGISLCRFCSYQRMTMKAILSKDLKQAVMTMW